MYEWAKGLKLPRAYAIPGPFSTSTSRQLEPVMSAIQDESVREVTVCKAIQSGGTLGAVEIPIAYFASNEPGPMMWTQQTDKAVKEHSKGRFNAFIRKVPQVKAILPKERHDLTTTEI
jgi:phage terminase large subunit GpA-like protein